MWRVWLYLEPYFTRSQKGHLFSVCFEIRLIVITKIKVLLRSNFTLNKIYLQVKARKIWSCLVQRKFPYLGWVRLEWILSTFPVTSRDQANFGKSPIFSFILGFGGWNRFGGIKYTLFDSLNPNLDKKGCFYENWIDHVMWLGRLIIFTLTLPIWDMS